MTISKNPWQGRRDAKANEYIFQRVQTIALDNLPTPQAGKHFTLLGFASDEGVIRNHGRPGAKDGPHAIRKALASMACHEDLVIYDAGDIACIDNNLESAQEKLGKAIKQLITAGHRPIVLGGGHETAWGHWQGLQDHKPAILNFDAHFDLRNSHQSTSGTPFKQIADSTDNFNYTVIGLQQSANTKNLYNTADKLNVSYIHANDIHNTTQSNITPNKNNPINNKTNNINYLEKTNEIINNQTNIYLSFCLDVLDASIAPGVSAPQANGLFLPQVLPAIKLLATSNKVLSFDIVELAPKYDIDNHTAKIAAKIVWEYITAY